MLEIDLLDKEGLGGLIGNKKRFRLEDLEVRQPSKHHRVSYVRFFSRKTILKYC